MVKTSQTWSVRAGGGLAGTSRQVNQSIHQVFTEHLLCADTVLGTKCHWCVCFSCSILVLVTVGNGEQGRHMKNQLICNYNVISALEERHIR